MAAPDICICVPARDEAELLPKLFAALDAQVDAAAAFRLCLLLDGCRDDSELVVAQQAAQARFEVVVARSEVGAPNAGRARCAALQMGVQASGSAGVLLTTDADSAPAVDWVASACRALQHADIVAGQVVREGRRDDLQARLEAYYDRLYRCRRRIDPVPWEDEFAHHKSSGANLAFRAGAYVASGGFGEHASGEDARLVDEAQRRGLRVRRDARVVVQTSDRLCGRAPGGFAAHLQRFGETTAAQALLVGHPGDAASQYRWHALARRAFDARSRPALMDELLRQIDKPAEQVLQVAAEQPNAEAFAMRIVPAPPGDGRMVSLPEAEGLLTALEQQFSAEAA